MARVSRPPGFDMTYRPEKATFLLPLSVRLPATVYFGVACVVALVVAFAHVARGTWLYDYVVEQDRYRFVTAPAFAILLFSSALAAVMRQQLTGVIVRPDGIETRELAFGMPKFRRLAWAQIDRVAIPFFAEPFDPAAPRPAGSPPVRNIRLDLWNGSHAFLPSVAKTSELAVMIERVALARAIPIEGGSGLLDDLGNPFEGDDDD